jgi:lambda family phage portal protein
MNFPILVGRNASGKPRVRVQQGFDARVMGAFGGFGGNAFDGGRSDTQETAGWNAPRIHMDRAFQSQGRTIVDRAEDLDRNSPWINGALDRGVESVIGNGLQLLPRPIYDLLGKDIKWSTKWSRLTRARYRAWSEDPMFRCDAKMRFNFGTLQRLAYLNFRRGGEALAEIRKDSRGSSNPLNVLLIDPKRLRNPLAVGDNDDLIRNGIEHSASGIPIASHILKRHPDDTHIHFNINETERVPFRSKTGTTKLIHVINPRYIEQSRGFSQLVESMIPAKMLDRYDRAVINRALVETLMGFFIESGYDPKDLQGMIAPGSSSGDGGDFENYAGWRQDNPVQAIGEMFMRHLVPGEKVVNVPPVTPGSNYPDFRKGKISEIAASHGLSYAQVSADWSDINYSSARARVFCYAFLYTDLRCMA